MNEQLKIIISAEIENLKKNIKEGTRLVDKFGEDGEKALTEFNDATQQVGDVSKKALGIMAGAVAGAVTALLALGESTREYRNEQAKLVTAFETAGGSAETAKATYNDLYRVLGEDDTAVEAANHLAMMTTNQKELSDWTNICQGVYATFGASLPIEGLTEAANETAKVGTVTGSLADALNWAGISEDAFNEKLQACNSEAEREKLIRETLNGVYSDAAANYEKNNAAILAQNEAQAKMNEAMAKLGEVTQPIMTMLTELGADILTQLTPYIEEFADKYLPDIQEALSGVGEAIGKVITWIADNWELVSTLAIIIAGISAALTVFSTVMGIVNAVMLASPVTWVVLAIVAAIAALVAIIVVVIKYWDDIKNATKKAWDAISNAVKTAVSAVTNKFNELKTNITNKVQDAFNAVKNKFNEIKSTVSNIVSSVVNTVSTKFNSIKSKITSTIQGARDAVKNAIEKIKSFFKFEWKLPKLKLPRITITGSFSLNPPSVPKFSITWHKLGGVFDAPTLFGYGGGLHGLGEDGAEAIVPLEKNTQWLDKIAEKLSGNIGNTPIVLQVDGKTFAQVSVDSINQLTRQRGSLPLVFA